MLKLTLEQIGRAIKLLIGADVPGIIWGGPGIGKTAKMRQTSDAIAYQLFPYRLSDKDGTDVGGIPYPMPNGAKLPELVHLVTKLLPFDSKAKAIAFLDEIDRVPDVSTHNAAMQLFSDREVNGHKLSPNARLFGAGNGTTDSGTTKLTRACANRVCHMYVETDGPEALESYLAYADEAGISPILQGFAKHRQSVWNPSAAPGNGSGPKPMVEYAEATPRSFDYADHILAVAEQVSFRTDDLIRALVAGCVGTAAGTEFMQYREVYLQCPRIEDIIATPDGVIVPADPGILYALTVSLTNYAANADSREVEALARYGSRWPSDPQAFYFHRFVSKQASVALTPAYQTWNRRNG